MKICPSPGKVSAYVAGVLNGKSTMQMMSHLATCSRCQAVYENARDTTNALKVRPGEFDGARFVEETWRRVSTYDSVFHPLAMSPQGTTTSPRWGRLVGIAATVVSAIGVAICFSAVSADEKEALHIGAGDVEQTGDRWVSVALFQREPTSTQYTRIADSLVTGHPIAVTYEDRSELPYPYLMVLAVDDTGEVYWLFPVHSDVAMNPESIQTRNEGGYVSLPLEVSHEFRSDSVRLFALFTRIPLKVETVEASIDRDFDLAGGLEYMERLRSIKGAQWTEAVKVVLP